MKTNSPNVLFNHQAKLLLGKTSQVMKQKLLFILMLVCISLSVSAQVPRRSTDRTVVLTEVNSLLSNSGSSLTARQTSAGVNVNRLRDLITQVQSSTYFFDGVVKNYGDVPTNLFTDLRSLSQLNNSITMKENIEIATININSIAELNSNIDLNVFSNFPNLKFIYFISYANTTSDNITSRIVNYDERFNVIYKIDKGDRNQ